MSSQTSIKAELLPVLDNLEPEQPIANLPDHHPVDDLTPEELDLLIQRRRDLPAELDLAECTRKVYAASVNAGSTQLRITEETVQLKRDAREQGDNVVLKLWELMNKPNPEPENGTNLTPSEHQFFSFNESLLFSRSLELSEKEESQKLFANNNPHPEIGTKKEFRDPDKCRICHIIHPTKVQCDSPMGLGPQFINTIRSTAFSLILTTQVILMGCDAFIKCIPEKLTFTFKNLGILDTRKYIYKVGNDPQKVMFSIPEHHTLEYQLKRILRIIDKTKIPIFIEFFCSPLFMGESTAGHVFCFLLLCKKLMRDHNARIIVICSPAVLQGAPALLRVEREFKKTQTRELFRTAKLLGSILQTPVGTLNIFNSPEIEGRRLLNGDTEYWSMQKAWWRDRPLFSFYGDKTCEYYLRVTVELNRIYSAYRRALKTFIQPYTLVGGNFDEEGH